MFGQQADKNRQTLGTSQESKSEQAKRIKRPTNINPFNISIHLKTVPTKISKILMDSSNGVKHRLTLHRLIAWLRDRRKSDGEQKSKGARRRKTRKKRLAEHIGINEMKYRSSCKRQPVVKALISGERVPIRKPVIERPWTGRIETSPEPSSARARKTRPQMTLLLISDGVWVADGRYIRTNEQIRGPDIARRT